MLLSPQSSTKNSSQHSSVSIQHNLPTLPQHLTHQPNTSSSMDHQTPTNNTNTTNHTTVPSSSMANDNESLSSNLIPQFASFSPPTDCSIRSTTACSKNSRPTRENVLRRLSDALMRRTLTMIDFSQRDLQPSDARLVKLALLQNPSLSVLKLGFNDLGDEGVTTLSSGIVTHNALSSLDLGFNNIGDEGCRALSSAISQVPSLHTLYLAGNSIGEVGACALANAIRGGCGLTKIHLTGNCSIGPDGIGPLMEAIGAVDDVVKGGMKDEGEGDDHNIPYAKNSFDTTNHTVSNHPHQGLISTHPRYHEGIQELYLGGTNIGHRGCEAIAKMLERNTSIRVLSLANNSLIDDDCIVIANAIISNHKLLPIELIQISFNDITCKGIEPLMNAVWGLSNLKELRLDNNRIECRGAQVVSAVVTAVQTLNRLDVGFNSIGALGMRTLMKAVAESSSLVSLSISGNNIDSGSAKAVAYAVAHNRSLKSFFLDHCGIASEGQRHITAGIVSNSNSCLQTLTGFQIGGNAVSLGLPNILQQWTNDQTLQFILFMWERMRKDEEEYSIEKELDPLHNLPPIIGERGGAVNGVKVSNGPLDPATVVAVAKRAYTYLCDHGIQTIPRDSSLVNETTFQSPLSEDVVMIEADGVVVNDIPFENKTITEDEPLIHTNGSDVQQNTNIISQVSSINGVNNPPTLTLDFAARKKKIVDWLCHNIHHLNELSQLPFNSSELWRLHQHYFTPTLHETSSRNTNNGSSVMEVSNEDMNSSSFPAVKQQSSILTAPCASVPLVDVRETAASEPVMDTSNNMATKPIIKRKVSYRFLHEATLNSSTPSHTNHHIHTNNNSSNHNAHKSKPIQDESVSKLIEDLNVQSMQPKSKRARRNRSRISYVPRIKEKLDSFLDSCHQKALVLMRQLHYVEKSLLNSRIYPLDGLVDTSYLSGILATDAEMILLDMM